MDTNKLKELAERATPGEWISRADGWTIRAYPDSRLAHDGIKVATTCPVFIQGQGETPDVERQVANQEFIATANPQAILGLIAEVERLRARLEIDDRTPYDGIACRDETIKGLDEKCDRLKAENEALRKDAERYRWLCASAWYVGPEPDGDLEGVSWHDHNATRDGVSAAIDAALEGGGR